MKQKSLSQGSTGRAMNLFFTILLFLTFLLCSLFLVLIGAKVYENVNNRVTNAYEEQVVMNYVANKIRQGDQSDRIHIREIEDTIVLEITRDINGYEYATWIYCREGKLCELFCDPACGLSLADGMEITDCSSLEMEESGKQILVWMPGVSRQELHLTVRTE